MAIIYLAGTAIADIRRIGAPGLFRLLHWIVRLALVLYRRHRISRAKGRIALTALLARSGGDVFSSSKYHGRRLHRDQADQT
jgi:hypothetical protein